MDGCVAPVLARVLAGLRRRTLGLKKAPIMDLTDQLITLSDVSSQTDRAAFQSLSLHFCMYHTPKHLTFKSLQVQSFKNVTST